MPNLLLSDSFTTLTRVSLPLPSLYTHFTGNNRAAAQYNSVTMHKTANKYGMFSDVGYNCIGDKYTDKDPLAARYRGRVQNGLHTERFTLRTVYTQNGLHSLPLPGGVVLHRD